MLADAIRVKRQSTGSADDKKEESFEQELCKDKDAGEWFRLVAGDGDNCRDVIQCTSSVSIVLGRQHRWWKNSLGWNYRRREGERN